MRESCMNNDTLDCSIIRRNCGTWKKVLMLIYALLCLCSFFFMRSFTWLYFVYNS